MSAARCHHSSAVWAAICYASCSGPWQPRQCTPPAPIVEPQPLAHTNKAKRNTSVRPVRAARKPGRGGGRKRSLGAGLVKCMPARTTQYTSQDPFGALEQPLYQVRRSTSIIPYIFKNSCAVWSKAGKCPRTLAMNLALVCSIQKWANYSPVESTCLGPRLNARRHRTRQACTTAGTRSSDKISHTRFIGQTSTLPQPCCAPRSCCQQHRRGHTKAATVWR